jgi:hypothetical protein
MNQSLLDSNSFLLDLPFKGARNYLHSTDIVPALAAIAKQKFGSEASLHSLTLRKPFKHAIQAAFQAAPASSGTFKLRTESGSVSGWLVETDLPVVSRRPFDSSLLAAAAHLEPGVARLLEPLSGFTALEAAVGLMKLVARQVDSRFWWLSQIELAAPLPETYPLQVSIWHNVASQCLVFTIDSAGAQAGSAKLIIDSAKS